MTTDFRGVLAYAKANPLIHGKDWTGWCEAFVSNAGGFTNSFPNAAAAQHASHVYSPAQLDIDAVPTGWLLWWDYDPDGHVAYAAPGGLALMASNYVTQPLHTHLGYVDRTDYAKRSGHKYLGASPDHGGQFLQGVPRSPSTAVYYTVQSGDFLSDIARAHHLTLAALIHLNPSIHDPNLIQVGQKVRVK